MLPSVIFRRIPARYFTDLRCRFLEIRNSPRRCCDRAPGEVPGDEQTLHALTRISCFPKRVNSYVVSLWHIVLGGGFSTKRRVEFAARGLHITTPQCRLQTFDLKTTNALEKIQIKKGSGPAESLYQPDWPWPWMTVKCVRSAS